MKTLLPSIVLALTLFPLVAPATIITTTADEDNGLLGGGTGISLREAVKYSGSGSTITFTAALSGQTIRLAEGRLLIDGSLTIDASALPAGLTLSADRTGNGKTSDDTYLILVAGGHLLLDSLTLTGSNIFLTGDPLLAPLGDYGGLTRTMPPLPGSPAIDAGGSTTLTTDQRGFLRLTPPDIGAVEYLTAAHLAQAWKSDADGDGSPFGAEIALGTDPATADSHNTRNLTAPVFNSSGRAFYRFEAIVEP